MQHTPVAATTIQNSIGNNGPVVVESSAAVVGIILVEVNEAPGVDPMDATHPAEALLAGAIGAAVVDPIEVAAVLTEVADIVLVPSAEAVVLDVAVEVSEIIGAEPANVQWYIVKGIPHDVPDCPEPNA